MELSTFRSEFVVLRTAQDMVQFICYKLIIMGVPIDGWDDVFSDNELVFKTSIQTYARIKIIMFPYAFILSARQLPVI